MCKEKLESISKYVTCTVYKLLHVQFDGRCTLEFSG